MKSKSVGVGGPKSRLKSIAFATAFCGITTGISEAAITAASGNAQGLNVGLSLVALNLNVSSVSVSGATPGNFNPSNTVASVTGNTVGLATVSTGVVSASTTYAGGSFVTSASSVANLELNALLGVLTLTTAADDDTITSTATVSGDYNAFTATGTSTFEGLTLNLNIIGETPVSIALAASYAPNTTILSIPGVISVVANEQFTGGNGVSTRTLEVNALRITLLNVAGIGGSVVVGHSFASLTAVPEPSYGIAALIPVIAFSLRRKRNRQI